MKKLIVFVFFCSFLTGVAAQSNLHFYPLVDYASETGLVAGGAAVYLFREQDTLNRIPPSMLKTQVKLGRKDNWELELKADRQLETGKYAIITELLLEKNSAEVFGIGDEIELNSSQKNTFTALNIDYKMLRRWTDYEFGFTYKVQHSKYKDVIAAELLMQEDEQQSAGGWCVGPGLTFERNTFDNQLFPTRGMRLSFDMQNYSQALQSDYTYEYFSFEAISCLKLAKLTTWANQVGIKAAVGDSPYQHKPSLGQELRCFQQGQFVDNNLVMFTSELRSFFWEKPYLRRFGLVAFFEAGEVKTHITEFNYSSIKFGFGIGIRYLLDIDELFTVRLDSGIYKKQLSVDFGTGEAF